MLALIEDTTKQLYDWFQRVGFSGQDVSCFFFFFSFFFLRDFIFKKTLFERTSILKTRTIKSLKEEDISQGRGISCTYILLIS